MKIYVIEEVAYYEYSKPIEAWKDEAMAMRRCEELLGEERKNKMSFVDAFEITPIELMD